MNSTVPLLPMAGFRAMFYLVHPYESTYGAVGDIPDYVLEATPYFVGLVLIETVIRYLKSQSFRINDTVGSVSAGIVSRLPKMLLAKFLEMTLYMWIHENLCVFRLPWSSPWTWFFAMIGVDFGYYWLHRASHEVNFLWMAHQVHHSSEDYNLSTALRQSVLQGYFTWVFYLPLAFVLPPSVFVVHMELNLLYQFWIHTELIKTVGPLEWILNTPSHHRVHHGRNRYCIDKNYAGFLIIWDRMFGTFEAEDATVVYGLVHPLQSFNPLWTQVSHINYIWQTLWSTRGVANKLSVILKGPGWNPGKPRTGLIEDIPDVSAPQPKYDPSMAWYWQVYIFVHFNLTLVIYTLAGAACRHQEFYLTLLTVLFIIFTLTSLGFICDQKAYAPLVELSRCVSTSVLWLWWSQGQDQNPLHMTVFTLNAISAIFMIIHLMMSDSSPKKKIH